MTEKQREWIGDWLVEKPLGKGGQGEVFLVRYMPKARFDGLVDDFYRIHRECAKSMNPNREQDKKTFVHTLFDAFQFFGDARLGALKRLHPPELAKNPDTAKARFAQELDAVMKVQHPALVEILDVHEGHDWFVMEYHSLGSLSSRRERYVGDLRGVLRALRPVVDGVAKLHSKNLIHRDIKPDNLFLSDDRRIVLGDFGLVYDLAGQGERQTQTYENVGSRDWMPPWAQTTRISDIRPTFDVFTIGKVLWAMVSGKPVMRLHYFRDPEFDLEKLFPNDDWPQVANRLLGKCVVEHEQDCLRDASELLEGIDKALDELGDAPSIAGKPRKRVRKADYSAIRNILAGDRNAVRLQQTLDQEMEDLYDQLSLDGFPVHEPEPTDEAVQARANKYDDLTRQAIAYLVDLCRWGDPTQNNLILKSLRRIARGAGQRDNEDSQTGFYETWCWLHYYPAMRLVYGAALAALSDDNFELLTRVLLDTTVVARQQRVTMFNHISDEGLYDIKGASKLSGLMKGGSEGAPVSARLFSSLREDLAELIRDNDEYELLFDRWECLVILSYVLDTGSDFRPAVCRATWKHLRNPERSPFTEFIREATSYQSPWAPLTRRWRAGQLKEAYTTYTEWVSAISNKLW
ncbi:MAG: protein kinase [Phycisphaerales bacterium]|nr:MAG: protein kinase [Phycisphaerales bacterium]